MNDPVKSVNANTNHLTFDQIEWLCQDFRVQWNRRERPEIADFLQKVAPPARRILFRNLLQLDIKLRTNAGEKPAESDYVSYSEFADLVRPEFSIASIRRAHSTDNNEEGPDTVVWSSSAAKSLPPAAERLGDYLILAELGDGGQGRVYKARHVDRDHVVALKTLHDKWSSDWDYISSLKSEFRSASRVSHRNLVRLYELDVDGGQCFFTMELLNGDNFVRHVRPKGRLNLARLRQALRQLVLGVTALHDHGKIHRDLKPGNVMVTLNEERVVVLDFGLVLNQSHDRFVETGSHFSGTYAYAAPEQFNNQAGIASDWYAVGTILYEALTGELPYQATKGTEWFQQKTNMDPCPIPGELDVPSDLRWLCESLLARDPADRPTVEEISSALSFDLEHVARRHDEVILVGRDQQREKLTRLHQQLFAGSPAVVFVSGRSGEGKSSLVTQFLSQLDQRQTVLSGRCYDRESVPFKALDSLIEALASHLAERDEGETGSLMPDDLPFLCKLFPALNRATVVQNAPLMDISEIDEQQIRQRGYQAFRRLLFNMSRRMPLILFIDDLQWGDSDSARAVFEVVRDPSASDAPLALVIGTYRSDEAADSPFLQEWEQLSQAADFEELNVAVGPLSLADCQELAQAELGKLTDEMESRLLSLHKQQDGNPYFLSELIRLLDLRSGDHQHVELDHVIRNKLEQLPQNATTLLEVVAVSGQAMRPVELVVSAQLQTGAHDAIEAMRSENLVRRVGGNDGELIDTYHDKIRENVLAMMDDGRRSAVHRSIGDVIEEKVANQFTLERFESLQSDGESDLGPVERVQDLAYHFDSAGDKRRALYYSVLAGRQAKSQYATNSVHAQFEIAARNCDEGTGKSVRFEIGFERASALMFLGRREEAIAVLNDVPRVAQSSYELAKVDSLQARIALQTAVFDRTQKYCESGLKRVAMPVPKSMLGHCWDVGRSTLSRMSLSVLPKRWTVLRQTQERLLAMELLHCHEVSRGFTGGLDLIWSSLMGLNLAERLDLPSSIASHYAIHAAFMNTMGWHSRAKWFAKRAMEIAISSDNQWTVGYCNSFVGIGRYAAGLVPDAREVLNISVDALGKTGDVWQMHMSRFHLACCDFAEGKLANALERCQEVFNSSCELDDSRSMCSSYLWSRIREGDIPFEEMECRIPEHPSDLLSNANKTTAEGYWHVHHRRYEEAIRCFSHSYHTLWLKRLPNFHLAAAGPALVMALRLYGESLAKTDSAKSAQTLQRAYKTAKRTAWTSWLFPIEHAVGLQELALMLLHKGRARQAYKVAEKSCRVAERQNAQYQLAQSRLTKARIAHALQMPGAAEGISTAEKEVAEFRAQVD